MNNSDTVTLILSRSAYVETNINVALIRLDGHEHKIGQPVMVRYYDKDGKIDTITAVGIKNGTGKDCYSILSISGEFVVNGVYEDLPDVSQLVNGAVYIAKYNGTWSLVYIQGGVVRRIDPNIPALTIRDAATGLYWYYVNHTMKCCNDFLTSSEVTEAIDEGIGFIHEPVIAISLIGSNNVLEKGQSISNPSFFIHVYDYAGRDIIDSCTITVTSNLYGQESIKSLVDNVLCLYGNINSSIIYTFKAEYTLLGHTHTVEQMYPVKFIPKTLWGCAKSLMDVSRITPQEILWGGDDDTLEITCNLDDECLALLVPSEISHFTKIYDVHGLDYIDDYNIVPGLPLRGERYTLYLKKDPVRINNFKQVFTK